MLETTCTYEDHHVGDAARLDLLELVFTRDWLLAGDSARACTRKESR